MTNNQEPAIIVKDVKKSFRIPLDKTSGIKQRVINFYKKKKGHREFKALDGVSFEVKKGEFFGVVGRNGSGKSTLLKILAGVYSPDSGGVAINGSLTPFIELGVGFNPELSGRENVYLNGALLGFSRKEMEAMYDDIVDFAELHDFMEERLKNYSSGMQVRLAFSIAIRAKTDILVLDEVLAVGDAAFQQKCNNYFEDIRSSSKTVILVSHNMDAIKRFCTRAAYIKNGCVVKEGSPFEVADAYLIDNLLGTQEVIIDELYESKKNYIRFNIEEDKVEHVKIKINYKNTSGDDCYARLSIFRNDSCIAIIDTDKKKSLRGIGTLQFTIDKTLLNPSDYSVGGGLHKISDQELVTATRSMGRKTFFVKGVDESRQGTLKLKDTWQYGASK